MSTLSAATASLKFVPGFFEFSFTLPQAGADQRMVVAVPHTATVATAEAMLSASGAASLVGARFLGPDQEKLTASTSLHAALQNATVLYLQAGESTDLLPVPVPSYVGGAYGVQSAASGYHRLNVREIMQKGAFVRTRRRLQALAKRTISWDEFVRVADENGVSRGEAEDLSAALHTAGVILHFRNHPDEGIRNTVFLQPEDVIDSVFGAYGLEGPVESLVNAERSKVEEQLKRIQAALDARRSAKQVVDASAASTAKLFNVGVLVSYSGMMGFMVTMTYSVLSWDIIEPVTWALGQGAVISGYAWWLLTRKELEFENMSAVVRQWQQARQAKRAVTSGADAVDEGLAEAMAGVGGPVGDLEVDIANLEAAEARCRKRLELLSMTRFSPALTTVYDTLRTPAGTEILAQAAAVTSSTSDDAEAAVGRLIHAAR